MIVWRIATDARDYTAEDLGGTGAKITGGRWNRAGLPVVYCASSVALAALETLVHLNTAGLPLNRYLVMIEIPEHIWSARVEYSMDTAPVGWDAIPEGKVSLDLGDEWLKSQESALLVIPSVVVPEEFNVLINPAHPDASLISATKLRKWLYDQRLVS